jgi:RNA polymerase sigma-70 factor (ECF subfamily)
MMAQERTDAELLGTHDPADFEAFYLRHVDLVTRYVTRRAPRPDLTFDIVAETFARALEHRGSYVADRAPAAAWLLGIARNLLIDAGRRGRVADNARRALQMQPLELNDADLTAIQQRGSGSILDALARLPTDQAEAVRRRVLDDAPYGTIAAEAGCSEQVARQRVHRGLRALRSRTEEQNA